MKSKGAIQAFTIALALACLFYMSFSIVTYSVNKDAEEFAANAPSLSKIDDEKEREVKQKELEANYLDSMMSEEVFNIGIASFTFAECKKQQLNLGLDLQGGMHVTIEVALDQLILNLSADKTNPDLIAAVERANELQIESQDPYVDLFYTAFQEVAPGKSLFAAFDSPGNADKFDRNAEDRDLEVINFIKSESEEAVSRTMDILRTRIDLFGVTQPTIRIEGSQRITMELPGVDDPTRVITLIKQSAELEFWETYTATEVLGQYFGDVNEVLVDKLGLEEKAEESNENSAANLLTGDDTENANLDNGDDAVAALTAGNDSMDAGVDSPEVDPVAALTGESASGDSSLNDSLKAAQAQEEFASKNPIYKYLSPSVDQTNGQIVDGPVIGRAMENEMDRISEYLSYPEVKSVLPADLEFKWGAKEIQEGSRVYNLFAVKKVRGKAPLDGSVITDAIQSYDQFSGEPQVTMKMDPTGARTWKALTEANIEKFIAISLDGRIYSAPQVNQVIPNGSSVISGSFTIEEAKDLSSVLKAGKLPITVDIAEQETVGPTLGAKNVSNGLQSLVAGFLLVLVFMAFYYRKGGWVANIALLANLFFIIGILASLKASLTLPGMAGIVLTIGMSVDANVLIFERIREELNLGKSLKQAISDGYKNAYSSIIDANLTTFLTGVILLLFGKGPISGFAVILVIGILTSLFSAIFLTRLIMTWMLDKEQSISFGSTATMKAFSKLNWDFIGKRRIAYVVSSIIIVAGLASLFTQGLNLSVDFEGGRSYVVQFEENTSEEDVRGVLTDAFESAPEVKTFGSESKLKITTKYRIDDNSEEVDQEVEEALATALSGKFGESFKVEKSQKVGPTFARDIEISAIWSIVVGLVAIFLYIIARFRKWQYGLGALLALIHDVLFVIGLFSLLWKIVPFNLEVDQAFIAAILTVVGYSINDTVVVFDRIRESLNLHSKAPLKSTINEALNKTVSRTMITSVTTLLVILILFIFGGETIRGFSFALLLGVLVGTYSSLFIATPVVVDLDKSGR
ncbi:MAG: protein translocase subunit SecDF [Bacteroidia bacterium]